MKMPMLNHAGQPSFSLTLLRFLGVLALVHSIMPTSLFADNVTLKSPAPPFHLSTLAKPTGEKSYNAQPPSISFPGSTLQELKKTKTSSSVAIQTRKINDQSKRTSGSTPKEPSQVMGAIKPFPTVPTIAHQNFPMRESEIFRFSPLPPLLLSELPKRQPKTLAVPSNPTSTNFTGLKAALYQAEPYSMLVLVPPAGVDEKMVIEPTNDPALESLNQMPAVKPELRLRPLQK